MLIKKHRFSIQYFINSQHWPLMIYDIKLHFANKFLCDRIVEYGIVFKHVFEYVRIHVCNWTHIESNTSMHGVKYKVISACTRIHGLDDSFVMGPRFCTIVLKFHKFLNFQRHAERVKRFSSSIVVDVDFHPVFSGLVIWIRIADVQRCCRCWNWQLVSSVNSSKSVSSSRIVL